MHSGDKNAKYFKVQTYQFKQKARIFMNKSQKTYTVKHSPYTFTNFELIAKDNLELTARDIFF